MKPIVNMKMQKGCLFIAATLAGAVTLMANPINITIPDNVTYKSYSPENGATSPWKNTPGLGAGHEDNETEPGTYTGDQWDLEAFVFNSSSSTLSLVGTFDFANGVTEGGKTIHSGAIFLKEAGSADWSYAYVLDFGANTYSLYDSFSTLAPTDISGSNPWTVDQANSSSPIATGSFAYQEGVLDPFGLGLQRESGTGHNEIDLTLNDLPAAVLKNFDAHSTMECGNDDIEGHYSVPDGGVTAALLAFGLLGLILAQHKIGTPEMARVRGSSTIPGTKPNRSRQNS